MVCPYESLYLPALWKQRYMTEKTTEYLIAWLAKAERCGFKIHCQSQRFQRYRLWTDMAERHWNSADPANAFTNTSTGSHIQLFTLKDKHCKTCPKFVKKYLHYPLMCLRTAYSYRRMNKVNDPNEGYRELIIFPIGSLCPIEQHPLSP